MELLLIRGDPDKESRLARHDLVVNTLNCINSDASIKLYETAFTTIGISDTGSSLCCANISCEANNTDQKFIITSSTAVLDLLTNVSTNEYRNLGSESPAIGIVVSNEGSIVEICNDGIAFIESFYWAHKSSLIFATHMDAVVAAVPEFSWDLDGVAEYLSFLHPLNDRTLVSDVSMLPGGSKLRCDDAFGLRISHRSLLWPSDRNRDAPATALIGEFGQIWSRVMERLASRLITPTVLGLSGGLDSRAIAVGLRSHRNDFMCVTYGDMRAKEVKLAHAVAALLKIPHLIVPIVPSDALERLDDRSGLFSGAQTLFELYEIWFDSMYRGIEGSFISGVSGDVFWGSDSAFGLSFGPALLAKLEGRYRKPMSATRGFLNSSVANEMNERAIRGLHESIEPFSQIDGGEISTYWNLNQRQRRWGFPLATAMRRMGMFHENPFYDSEMISFSTSIPGTLRRNGFLWAEIHKVIFESTSRIARANDYCMPIQLDGYAYYSGDQSRAWQLFEIGRKRPRSAMKRGFAHFVDGPGKALSKRMGSKNIRSFALTRADLFPKDMEYWYNDASFRNKIMESIAGAREDLPSFLSSEVVADSVDCLSEGKFPDYRAIGKVLSISKWNRRWLDIRRKVSSLR